MTISHELFEQQRRPRFGRENPERMQLAFWEWMIRGENLSLPTGSGLGGAGFVMHDGKLKSTYGPYHAREFFNVSTNREDGPIWTFDRMGRTCNPLPDGRMVCIGGEHEDFYDPDFYIYNDVVVFDTNGKIDICGYPKEIFPPTDFHTTTMADERMVIIGGLGYKSDRIFDFTPVHVLDLSDFHIDQAETTGEMPGWIHKHEAEVDETSVITVRGGQIVRQRNGEQRFLLNADDFSLDPNSGVWTRLTDRRWQQFSIRGDDKRHFSLRPLEEAERLVPRSVECTVVNCEWQSARIRVDGVDVDIKVGITDIKIVVRGHLPEPLPTLLCEEVLMNAQSLFQCRCSLERL